MDGLDFAWYYRWEWLELVMKTKPGYFLSYKQTNSPKDRQSSPARKHITSINNSFLDSFLSSCSGPTKRPCCKSTYVRGGPGLALVCSLDGGSGSESPKIPGWLMLLVFLWHSYPIQSRQYLTLFFHKSPEAPTTVSLLVSASVWVTWCTESLRGLGMLDSSLQAMRLSLLVSGLGTCS